MTTTDYRRPTAGRKYIEALEANDQAAREAARNQAREYSDVIHAVQKLRCPEHGGRFKHLLNNELICAHCGDLAITILERQHS